jgi:hypothetical protein
LPEALASRAAGAATKRKIDITTKEHTKSTKERELTAKNLGFRSIEQPLCGYPDQGYGRYEVLIVKFSHPS